MPDKCPDADPVSPMGCRSPALFVLGGVVPWLWGQKSVRGGVGKTQGLEGERSSSHSRERARTAAADVGGFFVARRRPGSSAGLWTLDGSLFEPGRVLFLGHTLFGMKTIFLVSFSVGTPQKEKKAKEEPTQQSTATNGFLFPFGFP